MARYLNRDDKRTLVQALLPLAREADRIELDHARRLLLEAKPELARMVDGMVVSHALRALGYSKAQNPSGAGAYIRWRPLPTTYLGRELR